MTLPRKKRIPRAKFPQTRGARAFFEFGSVSFFPELPSSAAVVTPKKVFPASVTRHRVKRRVLQALKRLMASSELVGGVIVHPNKNALTARFNDLEETLEKTLNKFARKS